ncbi:MAG: hypothetical protein ACFFDN_14635 [Candidatus Hodarchaeota archaeon]
MSNAVGHWSPTCWTVSPLLKKEEKAGRPTRWTFTVGHLFNVGQITVQHVGKCPMRWTIPSPLTLPPIKNTYLILNIYNT